MPKLDDAYRDQLTEEEVIALEADDEDAAEEALEAFANATPDADPEEEAGTEEKAEDVTDDTSHTDGEEPDPEPVPDDDPETPDPAPEPEPEPEAKAEPPKQEPMPDVEKARKDIADIKAERKDLRAKYDDGDLTDEEYDAQIEALDDKYAEAAADIKTAERLVAKQRDDWKQAGAAYLERYPELKADGVIQALDQVVQDLAKYPSVASLPHDQFLERVHRKLLADAEITGLNIPAIKKSTPGKAEPPKKTAPEGDKALGKTPQTLANVPSSDVSALDDSPYASLERLAQKGDPIAFENAMAKLPADKRDEFASLYIE